MSIIFCVFPVLSHYGTDTAFRNIFRHLPLSIICKNIHFSILFLFLSLVLYDLPYVSFSLLHFTTDDLLDLDLLLSFHIFRYSSNLKGTDFDPILILSAVSLSHLLYLILVPSLLIYNLLKRYSILYYSHLPLSIHLISRTLISIPF